MEDVNNEMQSSSDELLFAMEDDVLSSAEVYDYYKILIVDDEIEVHNVTKLVLADFEFLGKRLQFLSALSGEEAKQVIRENPDIAVIFMDVVMEKENSGLKVVKYIREELNNKLVRIILRTGQPGEAPLKKVIVEYDINDYKEKTELTSDKLFTVLVSTLRAYNDLTLIDESKKTLEKILKSSYEIFELKSMEDLAGKTLSEMADFLKIHNSGFTAKCLRDDLFIIAGTGKFENYNNKNVKSVVPIDDYHKILSCIEQKSSCFNEEFILIYLKSDFDCENVIYFENSNPINGINRGLLDMFISSISIASDNIYLNKEIENTQREVIYTLGEIAEARSNETGHHVKRVAEYSYLLAIKYGLSQKEAEIIKLASPMHDVGKLGIPDSILNKPGKLTPDEFSIMKTHTSIGFEMLKNSNKELMKAAAIIALQHHEKFDGTGYPYCLKGENIHIYGRITAIADVFDALGSERVYKRAWDLDSILKLFKDERGSHFDPNLIDLFFNNIDEIIQIRDNFRDDLINNEKRA